MAAGLRALGVRTFPAEAYFFLADFAPHDAGRLATRLEERGILVKPLNDVRLGPSFMRVTTASPQTTPAFFRPSQSFCRMARIAPFESHTRRYESWFAQHEAAYRSELRALRELLPDPGLGLEIGVGTGRFAEPLGIAIGIDPSLRMLHVARQRGIGVVCAVAEALPFRHGVFDHALIVTTICFVDDARAMLVEACRVLKPEGALVLGFIDRTSRLGRHYEAHRQESVFYRDAVFFSGDEVDRLLSETGFGERSWRQTLTKPLAETLEVEPSRPGFGDAAFVAVRAVKKANRRS